MKKKVKILGSIVLASLMTITGGIGTGNFKINNVQEVYAQTSNNVKFIPNATIDFNVPSANTVGNDVISVNLGTDRLYIDINGNIISKFKMGTLGKLEDTSHEIIKDYKYYGNIEGDKIITGNKSQETEGVEYGLIDTSGKMIIPYKYYSLEWAGDNILRFWEAPKTPEGYWDSENAKVGLIDTNGKVVVPAGKYVDILDFSDGYATAFKEKKKDENGNWVEFNTVYIDKTGKEFFSDKIQPNVGVTNYSKDGIIGTKDPNATDKNKSQGYLDLNANKFIIPGQFVETFPFKDGIAKVETEEYSYNYIDKTGKKLLPEDYESLFMHFSPEGYSLGKPKEKNEVHILNKNDLSKPYGIIKDADFEIYDENSFDKFQYLRIAGQIVKLSNYLPFRVTINDGLDQAYGFADLKGNVVIEPIFKNATVLQNNKAFVSVGEYDKLAKEKGLKEGVYILDFSKGVPSIENIKNAQPLDVGKVNGTVQSVSTNNDKSTTTNTTTSTTTNETINTNTTPIPTGSIKYKVQKWDTLGNISLRNYGSYAYHQELYRINKEAFAKTKGK